MGEFKYYVSWKRGTEGIKTIYNIKNIQIMNEGLKDLNIMSEHP